MTTDTTTARDRGRVSGMTLALVTATISGVAIFTNGYGVHAFGNSAVYTTAKNVVAAVLLLGLFTATATRGRTDGATRPASGKHWLGLVAVGVVGGGVPFLLFFEGLARASSADAAFLHKTLVVWVALLAVPLLRERIGALHVGAIVLLVGGQVAILGHLPSLGLGTGELMVLAATLLWSVEVVIAKRLLRDLSAWTVGAARMGIGILVLVGWTVGSGGAAELTSIAGHQWTWALLTGAILAAYVATWYLALQRAPAVDVTAVLVVGSVITAVLNAGIKGAPLAPDALGLVMITLATLALMARASGPRTSSARTDR